MKVLHTSDWHVGKRLERHDRMEEYAAAIDEVVSIADDHAVDLVLHSGDLFDRASPPVEALRLALDGLVRLAAGGERPVVAVAGNHDSPGFFETLAPFLAPFGVHLVGRIKAPDEGGVLEIETGAGRALIAGFPFLGAAKVVDFMDRTDRWYGDYAEKIRRITEVYAEALAEAAEPGEPRFIVGHFMVGGVKVDRAAPRGERELQIGQAYAATEAAVPPAVDYVALGHIHAPQPVPGARVPAEYAGSLLQLDFGEAGEQKRVVIVTTSPDAPAVVESVPLTSGRPLIRLEGAWEDLAARQDVDTGFLELTVHTDGPDPGLLERARERFPDAIKVRAEYERVAAPRIAAGGRPWSELYSEYHLEHHEQEAAEELLGLFREVLEEAQDAAP